MLRVSVSGFAAGMRAVFRHVAASDKLAAESQETEPPETPGTK